MLFMLINYQHIYKLQSILLNYRQTNISHFDYNFQYVIIIFIEHKYLYKNNLLKNAYLIFQF